MEDLEDLKAFFIIARAIPLSLQFTANFTYFGINITKKVILMVQLLFLQS